RSRRDVLSDLPGLEVGFERAAEVPDVPVQLVHRAAGRRLLPEALDEMRRADRSAPGRHQLGEQEPLAGWAQIDLDPGAQQPEIAEHLDPDARSLLIQVFGDL